VKAIKYGLVGNVILCALQLCVGVSVLVQFPLHSDTFGFGVSELIISSYMIGVQGWLVKKLHAQTSQYRQVRV